MYNKGALMLNTLRHITNNDSKWWEMLLKYSNTYKKQIIDTKTVIDFFSAEIGHDMTPFFNQYLKHTSIPVLVLKKHNNSFKYKWETDETNFEYPVELEINGKRKRILATNEYKIANIPVRSIEDEIKVRTDKYYIKVR